MNAMKASRYVAYFNVVYGIILLWVYVSDTPIYYDYFLIVGLLVIATWFSWDTVTRLKRQVSKLSQLYFIVAILTLFAGGLIIFWGVKMIDVGLAREDDKRHSVLGFFYLPFGVSSVYLAIRMLRN